MVLAVEHFEDIILFEASEPFGFGLELSRL